MAPSDAMPRDGIQARAALQFEVEQFLYYEAALLDDRKYKEWLTLIADDIHYWMPIRRTVGFKDIDKEFTALGENSFFDEDKEYLAMRVDKLTNELSWSENPASRTRHMISNVRILDVEGDEIEVELAFHLYRSRLDNKIDNWVGRRRDRLRRKGVGFELFQRHIFLDQTIINSTNMSILF